jgi:hypothetical protein
LLFLVANVAVLLFYTRIGIAHLQWRYGLFHFANPKTGAFARAEWIAEMLIAYEALVATNVIVLASLATILLVFLVQQCYYVSRNITQVERGRIAMAKGQGKYRHFYDRGFVQNWKECLFPPVARRHAPVDYSKEIAEESGDE